MKVVNDFLDYEIIDAGNGMKYERWNNIYLLRPDPLIMWNKDIKTDKLDAIYHRSNKGGGYWESFKNLSTFKISYKDLKFNLKQMGFKHTGLFPEQAVNWNYLREKIKKHEGNIKVLNLFAYTGAASLACLIEGASVTHVDSSRGMIDWAKENVKLNNLEDRPIRFLVDDVVKFVEREIRRGNKYDAIIMDPPSYGRGANGEVWDIEKDLFNLVKLCNTLLSDDPLFFLINSYTTGLSSKVLETILNMCISKKGLITSGEVGLKEKNSDVVLPCGIYGRWEKDENTL